VRVSEDRDGPAQESAEELVLRKPRASDGPRISRLVASSPPLDLNSPYCHLLQCTDFAETCVLAERDGALLGWISAYRPPATPEDLFVWQVAVATEARGEGLAGRMLDELIARPAAEGATALTATVIEENAASWHLFEAFALRHSARLERSVRFDGEKHFAGAHDTEWEARISPLPTNSNETESTDDSFAQA
jgi:L-2,4-diaminobutyric acid acetyltransferase